MGAIGQPCLDCGTPTVGTRCPKHETVYTQTKNRRQTISRGDRPQYGAGWKQLSASVRATATLCHLCGKGPRPNDPFQADHITPVQHGGRNGPVAAAHRSCNIAKGNRTRHQAPRNTGQTRTPPHPTPPTTPQLDPNP